ncbi:MAG: ROK family protein [Elusimicrobia bacterium]|nr:ROK family protein [Elusimicrobiota bacterium]
MIAIGIDVGGTFVKFFAVNKGGKVVTTFRLDTDMSKGPDDFIKQIADFVNEWKEFFKGEKIVIGIGLPGDVDNKNGVLRFGTNLKFNGRHIRNIKVGEGIEKLTGIKPVVANDATIAAWGVYELQLKKKYKNVLVITLGTGIGGGLILDGELFQGSHGTAGEIGHIKLSEAKDAPVCGCGARGCLESYAGTAGILRLVKAEIKKNPKSMLAFTAGDLKNFKVERVFEAAEKGCKSAAKVWSTVGHALGSGIAGAVMLLDLDAVVLTGGVSRAHKYFMPALKKCLDGQRIRTPFDKLKIFTSTLPETGGLGAALYAMNQNNGK